MAKLSKQSLINASNTFVNSLLEILNIDVNEERRQNLQNASLHFMEQLNVVRINESMNGNEKNIRPRIPGITEFKILGKRDYQILKYKISDESLDKFSLFFIDYLVKIEKIEIDDKLKNIIISLFKLTINNINIDEEIRPDIPNIMPYG